MAQYPDYAPKKESFRLSEAEEPAPQSERPMDAGEGQAMETPTCVRCPGVKLRLRSRELIDVHRLDRLAVDAALDARIWVCPSCRRIELQWPEDVALPEEAMEGEEKYLRQLRGMSNKELLSVAESKLRGEDIRAAARKLLAERK